MIFLPLFNLVSQLHSVHTRSLNVAVGSASSAPTSATTTMTVKITAMSTIAVRWLLYVGSCDKGCFLLLPSLAFFPQRSLWWQKRPKDNGRAIAPTLLVLLDLGSFILHRSQQRQRVADSLHSFLHSLRQSCKSQYATQLWSWESILRGKGRECPANNASNANPKISTAL